MQWWHREDIIPVKPDGQENPLPGWSRHWGCCAIKATHKTPPGMLWSPGSAWPCSTAWFPGEGGLASAMPCHAASFIFVSCAVYASRNWPAAPSTAACQGRKQAAALVAGTQWPNALTREQKGRMQPSDRGCAQPTWGWGSYGDGHPALGQVGCP